VTAHTVRFRDRPALRRRRLIVLVMLGALAPAAPGARCDEPGWDQLATAPADADLVVQFQDLGALARSPSGRALRAALADAGLFADSLGRWGALADHLGLGVEEALDELLGRRVTFVVRGLGERAPDGSGKPPDWAVVTSISRRGEQLVRERLRPAPRAKIAGQPLLAAEHGRFLLTLVERLDDRARPTTELILCPDESEPLLEELVFARVGAVKGAPRPALGACDEFALTRLLPAGEVLVAARPRDAAGAFIAASARSTERGWRVSLCFDAPAWRCDEPPRCFDPHALAELEEGALALVAESLPRPPAGAGDAGPSVWPMQLALPGDLASILTDRTLIRLDEAPTGSGAPLRLVIASETPGGADRVAAVDRAMTAVLAPSADDGALEGMIAGEFPRAVRTLRVSLPYDTPLGRDLLASWRLGFPTDAARAEPTWWAMCLSPGGSDTADASALTRAVATRLGEAAGAPEGAPVAAGVVRPRRIFEAVHGLVWAQLPPIPAIRWVESVRWRFESAPRGDGPGRDGLVRGLVDIEMNAAALDAPATPDPGVP